MIRQFKIFLTSLIFFTRIPVAGFVEYNTMYYNRCSIYLPVVGWIVGGVGALVYYLSQMIFPASVAVALSMVSTILVTGSFHEDGLIDSCDGLGGHHTKDKVLEIMKDSRVGAYGVIGIISILGIKYLVLSEITNQIIPWVIISGHSISRFITATYLLTHEHTLKDDENNKSFHTSKKLTVLDIIIAGIFGILPLLILGLKYLFILIPLLAIREFMGWFVKKRLDGYTGDCLGASQQISEVIFYLCVLIYTWNFIY